MEARDELSLSKLHNKLLIIDEIGYVPLSATRAELMYNIINQLYEISSLIITNNLEFSDWIQVLNQISLLLHYWIKLLITVIYGDSYRFSNYIAKQK